MQWRSCASQHLRDHRSGFKLTVRKQKMLFLNVTLELVGSKVSNFEPLMSKEKTKIPIKWLYCFYTSWPNESTKYLNRLMAVSQEISSRDIFSASIFKTQKIQMKVDNRQLNLLNRCTQQRHFELPEHRSNAIAASKNTFQERRKWKLRWLFHHNWLFNLWPKHVQLT